MLPPSLQPWSLLSLAERRSIAREMLNSAHQHLRAGNYSMALQTLLRAASLFNEPGTTTSVAEQLQGLVAGLGEVGQVLQLSELLSSVSLVDSTALAAAAPQVWMCSARVCAHLPQQGAVAMDRDDGDDRALAPSTSSMDVDAADENYVCPKCGGVVSLRRRAQHELHWCG